MQTIVAYQQSCVIQPCGPLNAETAIEFQRQLTTAVVEEGYTDVLVDLQQVECLDSAGLMTLVYGLRLAQALNRRFSICSASPAMKIIFELTQLDQVFNSFESIAAYKAAILT